MIELLLVEDSFAIAGSGIVLAPDFSVPVGWRDRVEAVTVVKPDGSRYEATARFVLSHFNIAHTAAPLDQRWRIVAILLDRCQADVPAGSLILTSQELRDALLQSKTT